MADNRGNPVQNDQERSDYKGILRNVIRSARRLHDVFDEAMKTSYRNMRRPPAGTGALFMCASIVGTGLAGFTLLGLAGAGIVPGLASILTTGAILAGVALYGVHHNDLEKKWSFQFASAQKEFIAATSSLPDGRTKDLSMLFTRDAGRIFAEGHLATMRSELGEDASGQSLARLHIRGQRLIDETARKMDWPEAMRAKLQEDFRKGQIKSANELEKDFHESYTGLELALGG